MANTLASNPSLPNYVQIVRHHETAVAALEWHFDNPGPDYDALPKKEFDDFKVLTLRNQESRDMLALLALLEACFRLDYHFRKELKLKGGLSGRLIRLYNRKKQKASLMEEILKDCWLREGVISHQQYDRINSAFKLRNWIAHGQYWSPEKIKPHDFYEVAEFVEGLINTGQFKTAGIDVVGIEIGQVQP